MLILNRWVQSAAHRTLENKIRIGDDIRITVLRRNHRSGTVAIGIEAPPQIAVDRPEYRESRRQRRTGGTLHLPRRREVNGNR